MRNSSVLSRKELIKQEYNHLLETRLPSIMHLMNNEKTMGLGGISYENKIISATPFEISRKQEIVNTEHEAAVHSKGRNDARAQSININHYNKQSMDYDDTEFLQKMFTNVDTEMRDFKVNNINLKNQRKSSIENSTNNSQSYSNSKNNSPERGRNQEIEETKFKPRDNSVGGHEALIKNQLNYNDPLEDQDILKIDRLQLINASARY